MKRDFCLLGQHPGLCRWVPRGPQWGGDDGGRSVNSGSRRPLVGPQTKTSHTVLCPSSWPDIKRSGPGPALWGRPPPPHFPQGNFIQCTHVPCVRKMQVSQRKPTFYRAPHTLWFVKGPCHGSRGWGRARDREQEVPRRPESQGHCGGGGGHTPRGPRSWGQWQGLRTTPPPTARQRGRSSRRPAGTAGSPGDQAGGRRLAVLGRLRVPP